MFENRTNTSFTSLISFNVIHARPQLIMFELLFLLIGGIVSAIFFSKDTLMGVIMLVAIFAIMLLYPFIYMRTLKRILRKSMNSSPTQDENTSNEFIFNENDLHINSTRLEQQISTVNVTYDQLVKVIEFKNFLYIYSGINIAYILEEAGMLKGDFSSLKDFLKNKLGDKYKIRKNYIF